jgi:flagellar hook-associated protein 3 FlgL
LRVTNATLYSQALGYTQKALSDLQRAQEVVSSGLRVSKPSDDPAVLGAIMRSTSGLTALEQYKENLSSANSRLAVEDATLEQLTGVLTRVKELGISQAGGTATGETRAVVQAEVEGLRDFVIELGNTEFAGSYIFGGQYADTRPFTAAGIDPAKPPTGTQQVEGGAGAHYAVTHNGQEVFVDSGVLDALEKLATALGNNSDDEIADALKGLDHAFGAVQELTGDLGARMVQVDTALSNLDALSANLQGLRSDLQEADIEETISQLVSRQLTYEAAMAANARIMRTSLTDYLR